MLFDEQETKYLIKLIEIFLKDGCLTNEPLEKEKRIQSCNSALEKLKTLNESTEFTNSEFFIMIPSASNVRQNCKKYDIPVPPLLAKLQDKLLFLLKRQTIKDYIADTERIGWQHSSLKEELKTAARDGGIKKYNLSESEIDKLEKYLNILPDADNNEL